MLPDHDPGEGTSGSANHSWQWLRFTAPGQWGLQEELNDQTWLLLPAVPIGLKRRTVATGSCDLPNLRTRQRKHSSGAGPKADWLAEDITLYGRELCTFKTPVGSERHACLCPRVDSGEPETLRESVVRDMHVSAQYLTVENLKP
ncbi:hypothetical protein UY3_17806 [Chelonia mydas]|uniref:Uncharacterized protein n=1 Tax=Chelonia mydas TaxID=8469 RepID=M7AQM6_CHEMY|nr:hypothetical protein UY3_17806 [Chelonia mydas]